METLNIMSSLLVYGPLGLGCAALGAWIVMLSKSHKKERQEWKTQSKEQFDTVVELAKTSTSTVESLKATLESIERSMGRDKG